MIRFLLAFSILAPGAHAAGLDGPLYWHDTQSALTRGARDFVNQTLTENCSGEGKYTVLSEQVQDRSGSAASYQVSFLFAGRATSQGYVIVREYSAEPADYSILGLDCRN